MIYIESISYPWSGMSCNHCDVHQGYKLVSHPVLGIWINVTIGFQVHVFFGERPDLGLVLMPYQYRGDISYFFWRQIRQQCFHLWVDDLMKSYEILWNLMKSYEYRLLQRPKTHHNLGCPGISEAKKDSCETQMSHAVQASHLQTLILVKIHHDWSLPYSNLVIQI